MSTQHWVNGATTPPICVLCRLLCSVVCTVYATADCRETPSMLFPPNMASTPHSTEINNPPDSNIHFFFPPAELFVYQMPMSLTEIRCNGLEKCEKKFSSFPSIYRFLTYTVFGDTKYPPDLFHRITDLTNRSI